jgi:hypothetical protein
MAVSTIDALYNGGSEKVTATSTGISVTGNLGIGTSSPSYKVTINTPDENHLRLENGSELGFVRVMDSGAFDFWVHGDNSTDVMTFTNGSGAGSERMRIDSSGKVGINTTTMQSTFNVQGVDGNIANFSYPAAATELKVICPTVNVIGLYTGAADNFVFGTDSTERMRIDSSGNLLVGGTTARSGSKMVVDGGAADTFIHLDSDSFNGTYESGIRFSANTFSGTNYYQGEISFKGNNNYSGDLTFSTAPSGTTNAPIERMRVDSSGNVLAGRTTTALNDAGHLFGEDGYVYHTRTGNIMWLNTLSSSAIAITFAATGTTKGNIVINTSSVSYNTTSDYRLKTDAQPMTGASARVQALNPVNFEWISSGDRVDGFLAHEAQAVVPESVTGTKDAMKDEEYEVTAAVYEDVVIEAVLDDEGNELEAERTEQNLVTEAVMGTRSVPDYQGIDQSKIVPLLTAALQEALTEIAALKARVTTLEG